MQGLGLMGWFKQNWKFTTVPVALASGTTVATTVGVVAQSIVDRCDRGTIATLDFTAESPVAWILFPIFLIGTIVIACGFIAAMIGIVSLFFKSSGNTQDSAAALKFQEQFFFDPSFHTNRLLIGWGFSSFAIVTTLLLVVGVVFGEKC